MTTEEVLTRGVAEVLPNRETLAKKMKEGKIKLYLGIDPTGSLLTLGHSVVLRKLQQFATLGHEVILLIGNGTVKIGDPTGRDSTRPMLTDEQIEENFQTWQSQASKILNFDQIKIMRNGDWLDNMCLADFIKLMAKVTVQQLIERDMFQERLKKGLPIHGHELLYPMLQGYDSVAMDVDLEVGGTDQTFNMMMGRNLQKIYHDKEKWVLTTPLINGLDGRKMSKSYNNYVALTENPSDMYGKLMRIDDSMIIEYFTLLTDTPLEKIELMAKDLKDQAVNPMELKKKLAKTITVFYHSDNEADQAEQTFEKVTQEKGVPDVIEEKEISLGNRNQISVLELMMQCNVTPSKSEAKRLLEQKAVTLAGKTVNDWKNEVRVEDGMILQMGKRKFIKIKIKE